MEKEEEAEKEKEKKRVKRLQRKNRDGMTALLDELHEQVIIKTDIVDLHSLVSMRTRIRVQHFSSMRIRIRI
jgi:hypothetical protein